MTTEATTEISERKYQAMEIMNQLGGRQFIAMTGARFITYDEKAESANLAFKFMGSRNANHIKIVLDAMDTYTVTFFKIRGASFKEVSTHEGIYNDMLQELFTEVTGLYTTLAKRK
jgi:hypothetical protein